jgi:hypothetical protein
LQEPETLQQSGGKSHKSYKNLTPQPETTTLEINYSTNNTPFLLNLLPKKYLKKNLLASWSLTHSN